MTYVMTQLIMCWSWNSWAVNVTQIRGNTTFVGHYFQRWINLHLVQMRLFTAVGLWMWGSVKINCSACAFMVTNEHVPQCNRVSHWCVFSSFFCDSRGIRQYGLKHFFGHLNLCYTQVRVQQLCPCTQIQQIARLITNCTIFAYVKKW